MTNKEWRLSAACLFLSLLSTASLWLIFQYEIRLIHEQEPFFSSPLVTFSQQLQVRNDGNAKGHFLARRDGGRRHKGVDLLIEEGKPILASRSGRVSYAGLGKGYGLYIEIIHPEGFSTRYAHLSTLSALPGDWVDVGAIIGLSGRTGNADNYAIKPHLHFEIRLNGTPLNPLKYMKL